MISRVDVLLGDESETDAAFASTRPELTKDDIRIDEATGRDVFTV